MRVKSAPVVRRDGRGPAAAVGLLAAGGALLYRFPPGRYGFYPVCPIHFYTGLLCPGCGATRALAALVHGDLAAALAWNALVVALLPVVLVYGWICWRRGKRVRVGPWVSVTAWVAAGVFTVARNWS